MDGGNDDWRPYALPAAILISAVIVAGAVMASTNGLTGQMRSLEATIRSINMTAAPTNPTPTPGPAATPTPAPTQAPANLDINGRPFTGNASAKVTIIAFSDFQCPYCGRAETTMKTLREKYEGKLKYVFMNFPLGFHQYAEKAAEGFECAAEQGNEKAFAMHDAMFANSDALTLEDIKGYAAAIPGMDAAAFNSCLDSGRTAQSIASQTAMGTANGVDGTPTFFINGQQIVGAQAQSVFETAITQALAQAGG